MNVSGPGIKASELIHELQMLVAEHGDKQVYAGGGDYPGGVGGVAYIPAKNGNGYVPGDTFKIWDRGV